jgi:hypothetical protein
MTQIARKSLRHFAGLAIFKPLKESTLAHEPTDLNASLLAYLHTIPDRNRLLTYLKMRGQQNRADEIEAVLMVAIKNAETFLYDQEGGVVWGSPFEDVFFKHLQATSPWLCKQAFGSLVSFGGWLCWHEGLNAPTT